MNKENVDLQYAQSYLEQFNKSCRLSYQTELINRDILFKIPPKAFSGNFVAFNTLMTLVQLKFELLSNQKDKNYENLKNHFFKHYNEFNKYEVSSTLSYLFNYSMKAIKDGKIAYREKLYNLYQLSFKNNLLSLEQDISSSQFLNIINLAAVNNKYEWARDLIEKYKPYCNNLDTTLLAEAEILFEEKKYPKILDLLRNISTFENSYFEYRTKTIALRCFYMLESYDEYFIKNYIRTFEVTLKRNKKINDNFKKSLQNFLSLYKKILLKKVDFEELLKIVGSEQNLQCRKWLSTIIKEHIDKK